MDVTNLAESLRLGLLGELVLAAILGGAVGLEREINGKPAGFRTNLLICVGAALITHLSRQIALSAATSPLGGLRGDPARLAAQIVSGIGFLGAGTIMQARGSIVGLTTAATLWVVAAIGIATGAHEFVPAIGTTVLVLGALLVLGKVERRMVRRRVSRTVQVALVPDATVLERLENELARSGFRMRTEEVEWQADQLVATLELAGRPAAIEEAVRVLLQSAGVRRVTVV